LDLPCPVCGPAEVSPLHDADIATLHKYAKSFRTRHLIAPRPDDVIEKLNAWLSVEPGLVHVVPQIHRDHHDVVSVITVTRFASSRNPDFAFRLERVSLLIGKLRLHSRDVGEMLKDWAEAHTRRERVAHTVFARSGRPTQCWILSKGPRDDVAPEPFKERARFGIGLGLFFGVSLFVGIIATVIIIASITNTLWFGVAAWPTACVGTPITLRLLAKRQRRKYERAPTARSATS
jgi:hypothetical protein